MRFQRDSNRAGTIHQQHSGEQLVRGSGGEREKERERERETERERKRERSRRSRLESVGAFSFRRRLFLDASLINIKQVSRAHALGFTQAKRCQYFLLWNLVPAAVPAACTPFAVPSSRRVPHAPSSYGDDLSLSEYASAISTGEGAVTSESASPFRPGRRSEAVAGPGNINDASNEVILYRCSPSLFLPRRDGSRATTG